MIKFRDLRADEIKVRVQSVKDNAEKGGLILLLYKDARCDMSILDETVGNENWQKHHYRDTQGVEFCKVTIKCGDEWIPKEDCGVESNAEAQKGEVSDSFKRACVCWGIGRELYTSPFIWVPREKCRINNGKCYDDFTIEKIKIENKKIVGLSIVNNSIRGENGKPVRAFVWQAKETQAKKADEEPH